MNAPSFDSEQRRAPRAVIALEVTEKRRAAARAVTRDISHEGMFIVTSHLLEVGTRFVVNVSLPGCAVPLELIAEVVRTAEDGMGVRLIYGGEAQKSYFAGRVTRLLAHRS